MVRGVDKTKNRYVPMVVKCTKRARLPDRVPDDRAQPSGLDGRLFHAQVSNCNEPRVHRVPAHSWGGSFAVNNVSYTLYHAIDTARRTRGLP